MKFKENVLSWYYVKIHKERGNRLANLDYLDDFVTKCKKNALDGERMEMAWGARKFVGFLSCGRDHE